MSIFYFAFCLSIYYAIHSVLASKWVKQSLRPFIPPSYYRICYNLLAIGLLALIAYLYVHTESEVLLEESPFTAIIGWLLLIAGIILGSQTLLNYDLKEFFGIRYVLSVEQPAKNELQTKGLNAWVRHPLYFSVLLVLWGWFLAMPLSAVLAIAVISSAYIPIGIFYEEQKLLKEFGEAYAEYKKRTPMLIPYLL